jgi:hypothetical protein
MDSKFADQLSTAARDFAPSLGITTGVVGVSVSRSHRIVCLQYERGARVPCGSTDGSLPAAQRAGRSTGLGASDQTTASVVVVDESDMSLRVIVDVGVETWQEIDATESFHLRSHRAPHT